MLPGVSAALQPHLTQQKQNIPARSHMCANFMLARLDGPLLVSKEMSKSNLHPERVCGEKLYQKGNGRQEGSCFGCAGHRPGPWNLAGVSVILKVNTTLGQLLLAPAVQVTQTRRALSWQRKGWAGQQRSREPPHPGLTLLPPPELSRRLQGHKCSRHKFS